MDNENAMLEARAPAADDAMVRMRDLRPLVQMEEAPQHMTTAAEALQNDPQITFRASPMMGNSTSYKPARLGGQDLAHLRSSALPTIR